MDGSDLRREPIEDDRLYAYDAEDRLIAPVMPIVADNDETAMEQAEKMLDGARVELRDGERLVMCLPPKE